MVEAYSEGTLELKDASKSMSVDETSLELLIVRRRLPDDKDRLTVKMNIVKSQI